MVKTQVSVLKRTREVDGDFLFLIVRKMSQEKTILVEAIQRDECSCQLPTLTLASRACEF